MHRKVASGIWVTLLSLGMLSLAVSVPPVETIVQMDEYYWVDGDNVDIGFSKYGEMISYDAATGVGVGLQYPGYEAVGTHDQTDDTSRDPFAHEGIPAKYWINGWLLEARYTHRTLGDRRILAAAMFADTRSYGGDWIVGKELPFTTAPYAGRKTTTYAETEAIQVLQDDPQRFKALCTTHIYDWEDTNNDTVVDHPTETWPVVDVLLTITFNKAKKEVILLKDVKLVISAKILDSPVDCQFSNRGQWDLGPDPDYSSYVHFYDDPLADIAQVISSDLDYVGWAAFRPHLSDYTVDGWVQVFSPLLNVSQPDMIPPGSEPDIPFIIGEWDFTLDYVDPFAAQFSGATIYGISDRTDGDDHDIGPGHENVVDSEVVIEVPAPPDLTVFDPEIDGLYVWINGVVLPGTEGEFITRIHWDWDDGSEEDHWFPASHTYSSGGDYIITVTAYQSDGLNSTETKTVSLHAYIYIRADGSVEPDTAPILSVDNITYTFTDNIYGKIVVERDNIVVDGANYTVLGAGANLYSKGINLAGRKNVTLRNMSIEGFYYGAYLDFSSSNRIFGNHMTNNEYGIRLDNSLNNSISRNNITANNEGGIWVSHSSFNSISGNNVTANSWDGILLIDSFYNIISENNATHNADGIILADSSFNSVSGNNITANNEAGIPIVCSSGNIIFGNDLVANADGILLHDSLGNFIYHNNFLSNTRQVYDVAWTHPVIPPSINSWDDGYPSGGNYWSDYTNVDLHSGPNQNETGSDGIWDHPYVIDDNNQDGYPLVNPWPNYRLNISSLPVTEIPFTIDGESHYTPYVGVFPEGFYVLEMPESNDEYLWSHWLEDGDTNRTKIVMLPPDSTWTGVYTPPRKLSIKLSGEHDYLFMERVKIRVAGLVTDAETMESVSGANVTIEIYDPEGNLWISDNMTERLLATGIYEWETTYTILQLMPHHQLCKGVYLAHVEASYRGGPIATDILEFHIDPPSEEPIQSHAILLFAMIGAVIISISVWYVDHRRSSRKLSELQERSTNRYIPSITV